MPDFIPSLPVILTFALAAIVLAITPGPDMALQVSRTVNYGRAHGLMTAFGTNCGLLIHSVLVALGISVLIVAAPAAFLALKFAGAIYLIWLAVQAILTGGGLKVIARSKRDPSLWESFLSGLAIDLFNPKVVLFFITFLPQFVDRHDPAASGKLFFLGAEYIVVTLPLAFLFVFGAEHLTDLFRRSHWVERALNYSFACVFTAFAVTILLSEGRK